MNEGRSPEFNITSVLEAWFGVWETDIILQPVCGQRPYFYKGNIDKCYLFVNGQAVV